MLSKVETAFSSPAKMTHKRESKFVLNMLLFNNYIPSTCYHFQFINFNALRSTVAVAKRIETLMMKIRLKVASAFLFVVGNRWLASISIIWTIEYIFTDHNNNALTYIHTYQSTNTIKLASFIH